MSLFPHQIKAVEDLERKNGVAWVRARVGAGKTVIAIEFLRRRQVKDALILTPKSAVEQWKKEIVKFDGNPDWTVVNYEKLLNDDFFNNILRHKPEAVIADEAVKVKSGTGKTAKRFRRLQSRYRIMLAANLAPNGAFELFSPLEWFSPGVFDGSFYKFRAAECLTNPHIPQQIIGYRNLSGLLDKIRRFTVEVDWTGEGELPSSSRSLCRCILSAPERKHYTTLEQECILEVTSGAITIPNILAKLTRLVDLVNDPELFGFPAGEKAAALEKILHESDEKSIIFSEHSRVLERFHARHGGELFIGSMSAKARQQAVDGFRKKSRYLWASSAAAKALNLQFATRVIHYGLPFTHEMLVQRFGRIHRIGALQPVSEIILIASDTCDERIWQIIEQKKKFEEKFNRRDYIKLMGL